MIKNPTIDACEITAVIVDAHREDAQKISHLLSQYGPGEIGMLGTYDDLDTAYIRIIHTCPDLIILDTVVQGRCSFELIERIKKNLPHYHFTLLFYTDRKDLVFEAFTYSGMQYVLKTMDDRYLYNALHFLREKIACRKENLLLRYQNQLRNQDCHKLIRQINDDTMRIKCTEGVERQIPLHRIIYMMSCQRLSVFTLHTANEKIFTNHSISSLEEEMCVEGGYFMRIHAQYIVNTQYIQNIHKKERSITLINNEKLIIAKRRWEDFMQVYKG